LSRFEIRENKNGKERVCINRNNFKTVARGMTEDVKDKRILKGK
jgi:hypothetical protein